MSTISEVRQGPVASVRGLAAKVGAVAVVAAGGLATYAAYGDPHAKSGQESAVPSLVVIAVVVGLVVYGWVVPKGLQSIRSGGRHAARWALVPAVVALLVSVAFWSGLPVVIGAGALMLAAEGRAQAAGRGIGARPFTIALTLAALAVVGSILFTVLGNTVMSHS
jgi:hypothetical protein